MNRLCPALVVAVLLPSPPAGHGQEWHPVREGKSGAALRGTPSEFAEAREPLASLDGPCAPPASAEQTPAREVPGVFPVGPAPENDWPLQPVSDGSPAAARAAAETPEDDRPLQVVWGLAGVRGFAVGPRTAPNGVSYHPLFSLDLDLNVWLCPKYGVYLFTDTRFWGQKSEGNVGNGKQGQFDFSKREFDLALGGAWNYWGPLEARVFAYSLNNLNRGDSLSQPFGFKDGIGLENRYYLSPEYAALGHVGFDVARATFVSLGYFPTKEMVGNDGAPFNPGWFARAYLLYDLPPEWVPLPCYAFVDAELIAKRTGTPKLFFVDTGLAARPFCKLPHLEFRLGTENTWDFQSGPGRTLLYGAVRVIF